MRTVIGIDPGLASTGWGVISFDGSRYIHRGHGVIRTDPGMPLPERLGLIHRQIREVLLTYGPGEAGVEELYFSRNATSAMQVAQARGVVLLTLDERSIPVGYYSPQQVKKAVIGRGRAHKDQVQRLVGIVLGLEETPDPDHAADALAIAICHANRAGNHVQQRHR
jgi:crossover junction endodeoxyribonuclease RuvC